MERTEMRRPLLAGGNYSYTAGHDSDLWCITTDVSKSGMGFYTDKSIKENSRLFVTCEAVSQRPLKAIVRWCDKIGDNLYRIGLRLAG